MLHDLVSLTVQEEQLQLRRDVADYHEAPRLEKYRENKMIAQQVREARSIEAFSGTGRSVVLRGSLWISLDVLGEDSRRLLTALQEVPSTWSSFDSFTNSKSYLELLVKAIADHIESLCGIRWCIGVFHSGCVSAEVREQSHQSKMMQVEVRRQQRKLVSQWDEGIEGMRVGGKRQLQIPAEMAYGDHAVGKIPPNSTLIFETELVDVKTPSTELL
eukprot:Skav202985  [mRNA]  locus=scaffold2274:631268:635346:- [translate_table: standard]